MSSSFFKFTIDKGILSKHELSNFNIFKLVNFVITFGNSLISL